MTYLSASNLNALQAKGGTAEKRYSQRGVVDLVADSSKFIDFIPPDIMEEMRTIGSQRDAELPAINDTTPTVVTTPGFDFIPANLPTSAKYTFTAVDIFSGFRFYPSTFKDNMIALEWERENRIKTILYEMAKTKETLTVTTMETLKTQVMDGIAQVNAASAGTISFASDKLTFDKAAQDDTMFTHIDMLYDINEIPGNIRYVTNKGGIHTQVVNALKYGAGNDRNLQALGLPDPNRYYQTTSIAADGDIFNGYAVRDGAIGYVSNHPYDFAKGTKIAGKEWSVSDMEMDWTRSQLNVYVNNEATKATSLVDSSDTVMTTFSEMALWDRFYIVYPYNSNRAGRAGDIFAIEGTTS